MGKIRVKQGELITEDNVAKVINMLEREKDPISKREACDVLNISYNTTRLAKIITEHKETLAAREERRKRLAKVPVSERERLSIISDYLSGDPVAEIERTSGRSRSVIERIIIQANIPTRADCRGFLLIDDNALAQDYKKDDLVFSAMDGTVAFIEKIVTNTHPDNLPAYKIFCVKDYWDTFTRTRPWFELADLRNVQRLGIQPKHATQDEIKEKMHLAMIEAKQRMKKK